MILKLIITPINKPINIHTIQMNSTQFINIDNFDPVFDGPFDDNLRDKIHYCYLTFGKYFDYSYDFEIGRQMMIKSDVNAHHLRKIIGYLCCTSINSIQNVQKIIGYDDIERYEFKVIARDNCRMKICVLTTLDTTRTFLDLTSDDTALLWIEKCVYQQNF